MGNFTARMEPVRIHISEPPSLPAQPFNPSNIALFWWTLYDLLSKMKKHVRDINPYRAHLPASTT
jgi:hypothetical protein|tara:strand:+ start:310 stop:504 length:195 start_codon:yes stop_codon:yes gene_type:complete